MTNPYTSRPVTAPDYFVADRGGRGTQARTLLGHLRRTDPPPDSLSLVGERRFGKTSLLGFLWRELAGTPALLAAVDMLALPQQNAQGFYAVLTRSLQRAGSLPSGPEVLDYLGFQDFLQDLRGAGGHLIVFVDEFDIVARNKAFSWEFFDTLRSAASTLPLTLVVASVAPLVQVAHAGVYGSPFFNIFNETRLGPLSRQEAEALVRSPPGGTQGLGEAVAEIIELAGCHPFFLQRACGCAWDLREAGGGWLDLDALRRVFAAAVRDHWQYIWDHSHDAERQALCALTRGTRAGVGDLSTLIQRGYVGGDDLRPCGEGFTAFVRQRCAAMPLNCPGAAVEPKPAAGRTAAPPLTVSPAAPPRRLALVVGVNQYRHQLSGSYCLPALQYAERDAEEFAALFTTLGFEVRRLRGDQATRAGLDEAFAAMGHATFADPHPDSCFVFHFSGHGQMDPGDDETAYLVLQDTDPGDLAATGLEMSRLVYQLLPQVRVPNALVLLDACHAGFAAGVRDLSPVSRLPNVAQQLFCGLRGRMVLAACAGGAQAREKASLGHGVFTYYVLRHWRDLDGPHPAGSITFGSLVDYVGQCIPQDHPDVPLPVYNGVGVGGTLVLRRT